MKLNNPKGKAALDIVRKLKEQGFTAYFAGGCVRDYLMGEEPHDFDIATTATPEHVERLFKKTVPVGKQFGVILVVKENMQFEVATFRKEGGYQDGRHPSEVCYTNAEEDAKRRDFTANGIFFDPIESKVYDYVQGEADIRRKALRAIGNPETRFHEDKLRLLRALRFAATLNFEIEEKTWQAICDNVASIKEVSPERIRDELVKMFTRKGAARGFSLLSDSGMMKIILPEIEAMKGVKQPPEYHPEGDVFVHTRMLLELVDEMEHPSLDLAFGALFHDIAKPETYAVRDGRITFYEHAPIGARMTEDIMKRLRFSNRQIEAVTEAVRNHMKFGDVQKMRSGKLKQFISRDNFLSELELHRIDCSASHGILDNYYFLKEKLIEFEEENLKPKPLINGNDLKEMGMNEGPQMKPVLEEVYELQLEGKFTEKKDAVLWVKERIKDLLP